LKKKTSISFNKIRLFRKLIRDFTNLDSKLNPFLQSFVSLNAIKANLNIDKPNRDSFSNIIKAQYDQTNFFNSNMSNVYLNISKLSKNNVYTITTGHQLNIFLSPLFLIYKIISVIAYANYLNHKIKGHHFVPCFWMATEDHDFDEIKSLNLYGDNYHWDLTTKDAVGNLASESILNILSEIKDSLLQSSYGQELFNIYNYAYSNNKNYANATRSVLSSLFGDYGLVVVDGNNAQFKKMFAPYLKEEFKSSCVYNNVSETNKSLKINYRPEINAMKNNIFYLKNNIRSKIQFNQTHYFSIDHNQSWSKDQLLDEISSFPERFSPNVFLRTLYQECIMPNILYLGGPSEISYWIQLKKLFQTMDIDYPLLELRSHFLFLSKDQSDIITKINLNEDHLFHSYDEKIKHILQKESMINFDDDYLVFQNQLMKMEQKMNTMKGFPINSLRVFEKRLQTEFSRLSSKVLKFEKAQRPNILCQVKSIHETLFPNNSTQEKIKSFIPYYIKYGKGFFDLLIKESPIFDNKYTILTEED